jgi:beta-lactamase regulating signal transducer with metallopeptidase domain
MVAVTRIRRLVMLGRAGRDAAVTDEPRLAALLTASRHRLGVERPVRLLLGGPRDVPMTWGWWRPRILLPSGALAWPDRQVELILLHELAHVRRGDVVLHRVAELASVVLWFHPLTWYAMRRMTVEREYACDDAVVRCGVRPGDYATALLALAQSVLAARALTAAPALTSRSQIRSRLLAILDDTKARSRRPGAAPSTVVVIGVFVALSISAVRPNPLAVSEQSVRFRLTTAREQAASPYEFRFRYDLDFAFDFGRGAPARRTRPEEHPE